MVKNLLKISVSSCILLFSLCLKAQEPLQDSGRSVSRFVKGTKAWGVTVGTGLGMGALTYNTTNWPFLGLHYEKGIKNIGSGSVAWGAMVAYNRSKYQFDFENKKYHYSSLVVTFRGIYHFHLRNYPKIDPYLGGSIGGRLWMFPKVVMGEASQRLSLVYAGFVGVKYNFRQNIAAFAEAGYDVSYARIGICITKN